MQGGVTWTELGKLLETFKTNILNTISDQLDTLKINRKNEEERVALAIFLSEFLNGNSITAATDLCYLLIFQ